MGDESFYNKQYQDAIASCKRPVAENATDTLAYYQMGICYELPDSSYDQHSPGQQTEVNSVSLPLMKRAIRMLYRKYHENV
jgi:hypothetical protein